MPAPKPGYLGTPAEWQHLVEYLRGRDVLGLDTEFYGVDLSKKSPVGRSKVHVFSLAMRTSDKHPELGFHKAIGWCLPVAALEHPGIRYLLESPTPRKAVHNQSVDHHALRNHGIELRGAVNTLGLLRWHRPGLINEVGRFALKPNMERLLGRAPVCTFKELVTYKTTVYRSTWRKVKKVTCDCGTEGCRKRKHELVDGGDGTRVTRYHDKTVTETSIETVHSREVDAEYPLESIVPGHPRWDLLVRYAIDDAVAALEFEEIALATPEPAPWPYSDGGRPAFSQAAEEEVIAMEAVGIPIDVRYAEEQLKKALADEETLLAWLDRWFRVNVNDGLDREQVDAIWSSPQQKVALFDELDFPRSPVWQKGKVKRGEVKMDQAALAWIAKNEPRATQLCGKLLRLQRIRSGKKYLEKLIASGGTVFPTCGPSGDDDQRAGAVTGRLGVKVELEAQQLPSIEDKDLYQIRKAIIAWHEAEPSGSSGASEHPSPPATSP